MRLIIPFLIIGVASSTFIHAADGPLRIEKIASNFHDPMSLAIAPDGDVYVVEREGRILRVRPATGGVFVVAQLQVSALRESDSKSKYGREDALHGIALDPAFAKNHRVYLFYSVSDKKIDRLSRFVINDGQLDRASEKILIDIPVDRENTVCHHGGSVQFGPDGLLYLSVGDNTNPFESDGRAPIDYRPDRQYWDSARGAGNTNDLRGKILRIRLTEDGYEIPPGNLFPKGTAKTRPEIYVMGCRNPFRTSIDRKNSTLYWGEVGPDAGGPSDRGPGGYDEFNQAKAAGNFGWPFVIANNQPYPIFDFATNKLGLLTDPAAPRNDSPRNTGLKILPPAQPAFIWYPYADSKEFPVLGKGGRSAMAGPVFYYDAFRKYNLLPREDDHTLLAYEWMRGKIWKAKLGAGEKLQKLEVLTSGLRHPMDMEMASDGSIYMLDYGSQWYFNKDGFLAHLLPTTANRSPEITIEPVAGKPRTFVVKSATDSENDPITVDWWLTTGLTERMLGSGSRITVPVGEGSEIRAVASNDKSLPGIARVALVEEKILSDLAIMLKGNPTSANFGETISYEIKGQPAPDAAKTIVRVRYIPPTGHDAGGPEFSSDITKLITASQCFACHQIDKTSAGPAYVDVALKYHNQPEAMEYLKSKLKTGGAGVWGATAMPPQIAASDADKEKILHAILALADGMSSATGPVGNLVLPAKPANAESGGAWEFSADSPGFSPARLRLPEKQ